MKCFVVPPDSKIEKLVIWLPHLHTVVAFAGRAEIKTECSTETYTIIVFFFAVNKK